MKYTVFWGCKIPYFLEGYRTAARAVLEALGVTLEDMVFRCCGYPARHLHFESYLLSAARNLAQAETAGRPLLTPCKCCFGSLKHAEHMLREQKDLRKRVNAVLKDENLQWRGDMDIKHLLTVLAEDVGIETVREKVRFPYDGLRVAAHYGCHALRPSNITRFDDPLQPTIFERLIEATGAKSLDWDRKLECCGQPVWGKNDSLSIDLMRKKVEAAIKAGAHCLCTACTYCQLQFDLIQKSALDRERADETLPALLYPQLLGLAMGLDEKTLGLEDNHLDPFGVKNHIGPGIENQEQTPTTQ